MLVVDFLREHGLDALVDKFKIHAKRHGKYPNLILFKYNQLESPMSNKIVQECRGLILDEAEHWQVVCRTYDKFFNAFEGNAAEIDWDTARIYNKEDGSLIQLYYYDGRWNVSSSGLPDASGEVNGFNITFNDLFWKVWKELDYRLPERTDCCYAFELCTPKNRVVVRHKESRIVLHGARRLSDFRELNPVVVAHENDWECVEIFPMTSLDEILEASKKLDPLKAEGFIACDLNYNRVKVKSPAYLAVSRLKESVCSSQRQLLEKIRINDCDEFISYFPEMKDEYYDVKIKYERLLGQIEGFYSAIKDIDDRKMFALKATTQKFSGLLFSMKFGKIESFKAGLAEMNIKHLENWLGLKSVD